MVFKFAQSFGRPNGSSKNFGRGRQETMSFEKKMQTMLENNLNATHVRKDVLSYS